MCVTKHGVYLVTEDNEVFLGRLGFLTGSEHEGTGEGISPEAAIMDIVADIAGDPTATSKTVTIEIR